MGQWFQKFIFLFTAQDPKYQLSIQKLITIHTHPHQVFYCQQECFYLQLLPVNLTETFWALSALICWSCLHWGMNSYAEMTMARGLSVCTGVPQCSWTWCCRHGPAWSSRGNPVTRLAGNQAWTSLYPTPQCSCVFILLGLERLNGSQI